MTVEGRRRRFESDNSDGEDERHDDDDADEREDLDDDQKREENEDVDEEEEDEDEDDGSDGNDPEECDSRDTTLSYTTVDHRHYLRRHRRITSVRLPVGGPLAATRAPCSSLEAVHTQSRATAYISATGWRGEPLLCCWGCYI